MNSADLLRDHFDRISEIVNDAVDGLTPDQLSYRPDADANSIAWLTWHLTRVQDDHVADVAGTEQVWTSEGWAKRFALPFDDAAHGYGQSSADVAKVKVDSGDLLTGYLDAVTAQTKKYVATLSDADLDKVVDTRWDPPVTLGVRLVSVIGDDLQHAGQASYIRGLIERR